MKKNQYIIMAIAAMLAASSCQEKIEEQPAPSITVTSSVLAFEPDGGAGSIVFSYDGAGAVSAKADKPWLTIDSSNAGKVSFTVAENPDAWSRIATITLTGADAVQKLDVMQKGSSYELDLDGDKSSKLEGKTLASDPYGVSAIAIAYDASLSSTVPAVSTEAEWIHWEVADGKIIILPELNLFSARNADVTITMGWKNVDFKLSQAVAAFFTPGDITLPGDVKTGQIDYVGDVALLGEDWTVETSSWIHAVKGETGLELAYDPNTSGDKRSGQISVLYKGAEFFAVAVAQDAVSAFSTISFDIDARAAELEIPGTEYYVTLPEGWTIETENWIHASKGDGSILLAVDENTSGSARTGAINVVVDGKVIYSTTVSQTGYSYDTFLGTWNLSGAETLDYLEKLTFSVDEDGKTYTVTDWRPTSTNYKKLSGTAKYEVKDGVPCIVFSPQCLANYTSGKWAWLCLYYQNNSSASYTYSWGTSYSVDFVYNMDGTAPKLTLTDNGSRSGYTCYGLHIIASTSETPVSGVSYSYIARAYKGGPIILSK